MRHHIALDDIDHVVHYVISLRSDSTLTNAGALVGCRKSILIHIIGVDRVEGPFLGDQDHIMRLVTQMTYASYVQARASQHCLRLLDLP